MTLLQALAYFLEEATKSLLRAWRASAIAIATIALSVYVGSFVLLVTGNLSRATSAWQDDLRISVYLTPNATPAQESAIRDVLQQPAWILSVERVSSEEAAQRFGSSFPRLSSLTDSGELEFPSSFEAGLDLQVPSAEFSSWRARVAALPGVEMIDDDRQWISSLSRLVGATRSLGLVVGLGLLIAAAFTIASVVRLTAYLYLDEITVLRHVGATEFFIRGPFYMVGLLQGFAGGLAALGVLSLTRWWIASRSADAFWQPLLVGDFLSPLAQVALVLLAALAGFLGAFVSLRRERLDAQPEI